MLSVAEPRDVFDRHAAPARPSSPRANAQFLNKQGLASVDRGIALGLRGDYGGALRALRGVEGPDADLLAGIACLHLGRPDDALGRFRRATAHPHSSFLTPAFADFVTQDESEASKMYGGTDFAEFFRVAAGSRAIEAMYTAFANTVVSSPPRDGTFVLVDLGIGPGEQIVRLIRRLHVEWPGLRRVRVFGVEPYEVMQPLAGPRFRGLASELSLDVEYTLVPRFAQGLGPGFSSEMLGGRRPDVVNACLSLHHMRREQKIATLKSIAAWRPRLLTLTDAESDHESTIPDLSYELVINVVSHYERVREFLLSEAPDPATAEAYRAYCYYDARNVVVETGDKRIEFHTTAERWKGYLFRAGFELVTPRARWLDGIDGTGAHVAEGHLCMGAWDVPLNFQLTARVRDGVSP